MIRIVLLALLSVVACNSKHEANSDSIEEKEDTITELRIVEKVHPTLSGCYSMTVNNDSAILKLNVSGNKVNGDLKYRLYEKDANSGTLTGDIFDTLILANYTFKSEGITSVREMVFEIKGDSLLEGVGEMDTSGDTIRFKNKARLSFDDYRPFVKGRCND